MKRGLEIDEISSSTVGTEAAFSAMEDILSDLAEEDIKIISDADYFSAMLLCTELRTKIRGWWLRRKNERHEEACQKKLEEIREANFRV